MTGPGTVKVSVHVGLRPALWSCVVFVALAAVTAAGIPAAPGRAGADTHAADVPVAA
jgi:hypothetical protein